MNSRPHPFRVSFAVESDSLYFRPDEIPALRKRLETVPHLASRWRLLQKNADVLLRDPLARGPLDIQRTRAALGNIGITAFAFALTQKRKFADRALREANSLLDEPTWTKPAPANRGANLATGEASTACALAYDWCRAALTDSEKATFRTRLFARGIQPYLDAVGPLKDWWRDNDVTNWSGVVNGGCGLAALALASEMPEARTAAGMAWKRIEAFLKTANRADGGGDEGVMYYTYGMLFANYFAVAAARRFGDDRGVFRDATEKMAGYYLVGMQGSDGKYANFNDMGDDTFAGLPPKNPEGGPNATLCALWESKTPDGDKLLAWAADNGGDNYYWRGASPFALLFRGLRPAPPTRPRFQPSALFRESGQTIWQTPPALWFAFNGGWTSDKSHYNLDLGSFVLVAHGERLIWDVGYGKVKTGDHSALLVDGIEQVKAARANYEASAEGDSWRWLACDVSQAYKNSPLTRWVRHAVLLESDQTAPILLIVDDLAASRPVSFETRLQIKGVLTISGSSAVVRGNKAALSIAYAASGPRAKPEIASGKGASDYVRASLPTTTQTRLITALCPVAAATQNASAAITLTTAPTTNGGFAITVEREKQKSVLTFAVADGKLRLVTLNGRATPNLPGAERRSLRRVS